MRRDLGATPRGIDIPEQFSGTSWEDCLERVKALANDYISSATGTWLQSSNAVGIGFVDGDFEVIWARAP